MLRILGHLFLLQFFLAFPMQCVAQPWLPPQSQKETSQQESSKKEPQPPKAAASQPKYRVIDYSYLIGMPGFTEKALQLHFKLYAGYVKNTNELFEILHRYDREGKTHTPEYAGIKRMFGWEFDGMRLHELYFSSLGGKGVLAQDSPLRKALAEEWGSYEAWLDDFIATASIRGIGWAILYRDPASGRFYNAWINEHNLGHLAGTDPLLPIDLFEHAYLLDYGLDRAGYIKAFLNNLNWAIVEDRFEASQERSKDWHLQGTTSHPKIDDKE